MKKLLVVLAAVAAASVLASTALADIATVNPYQCATFSGGSVTRPAGSTIVVRQGFSEQTLGILTAGLRAQTSTVSINGGAAVDVSDDYIDPVEVSGGWLTRVDYATGITLESGQSLSIVFTVTLAHVLPEVFNPAGGGTAGQPVFNNPGTTVWSCTVTGV